MSVQFLHFTSRPFEDSEWFLARVYGENPHGVSFSKSEIVFLPELDRPLVNEQIGFIGAQICDFLEKIIDHSGNQVPFVSINARIEDSETLSLIDDLKRLSEPFSRYYLARWRNFERIVTRLHGVGKDQMTLVLNPYFNGEGFEQVASVVPTKFPGYSSMFSVN